MTGEPDYGVLQFLCVGLEDGMNYLYALTGNYGLAIIILAVLMKLVFLPLHARSMKSAQKMRELQPKLDEIKQRYKDDHDQLRQETANLFQKSGVNPLAGCLPLLPQMPIYFAFFKVLTIANELRGAPFFGWIRDLSIADRTYVLPVLAGILMFIQQRYLPGAPTDKNMATLAYILPIVFIVAMGTMPAGLILYYLTGSCFQLLQSAAPPTLRYLKKCF